MGISQCLETLFTVTAVRVLLASGGERPGVMLNIPQLTGKPRTTKDGAASNVTSAELEKP